MKFFTDCKTPEEAKATFRKLAKFFHPDKGGSIDLIIELQKQYNEWPNHQNVQYDQFNTIGNRMWRNRPQFDDDYYEQLRQRDAEIERINALFRQQVDENLRWRRVLAAVNFELADLKKNKEELQQQIQSLINSYPKSIWQYFKMKRKLNEKQS